jgi:hypothetical protein
MNVKQPQKFTFLEAVKAERENGLYKCRRSADALTTWKSFQPRNQQPPAVPTVALHSEEQQQWELGVI